MFQRVKKEALVSTIIPVKEDTEIYCYMSAAETVHRKCIKDCQDYMRLIALRRVHLFLLNSMEMYRLKCVLLPDTSTVMFLTPFFMVNPYKPSGSSHSH